MEIQETTLPGVGLRQEFTTSAGRQLGVVSYRTGRRDLLLYDLDDPDACQEVIRLTPEEADALADLLGATRLSGRLAELHQQLEGLAISWLTISCLRPGFPARLAPLYLRPPAASARLVRQVIQRGSADRTAVARADDATVRSALVQPSRHNAASGRPRPAAPPIAVQLAVRALHRDARRPAVYAAS
jgi:TrkA domain protein